MNRRARPLLGTIVDICLPRAAPDDNFAINLAFSRIQQIESMMSFHDLNSDLNKINQSAPGLIEVHEELVEVLQICLELEMRSDGAFNPNIAKFLIAQQLLPQRQIVSFFRALREVLEIVSRTEILLKDRVALDLGGIAKGYAVDEACRLLQENGEEEGIVNAGGDLRVFGPSSYDIVVRNPEDPGQAGTSIKLQSEAFASSASYFIEIGDGEPRKSAIIDGRSGSRCFSNQSVSIKASSCVIADALTKLPFILGESEIEKLLEDYDAEMFMLTPDNLKSDNKTI